MRVTLNRTNWNTHFKHMFQLFASLKYDKAADIIITGEDHFMGPEPKHDMIRWTKVEGIDGKPATVEYAKPGNTAATQDPPKHYPQNEAGKAQCRQDSEDWNKLNREKRALISQLLMRMESDIRDEVTARPTYADAFKNRDLLKIWQMVEEVVFGRGSASINVLLVRLLKLKQDGEHKRYPNFLKVFTETVGDLMRVGKGDEILEKLITTLFVLALDQDFFKDKLKEVYSQRDWPEWKQYSNELSVYAESTERMNGLRKGDDEGKIKANVAEVARDRKPRCHNCDGEGHRKYQCDKAKHTCKICGFAGHLEKYCYSGKSDPAAPADRRNKAGDERAKGNADRKGGYDNADRRQPGKRDMRGKGGDKAKKGGRPANRRAEVLKKASAHFADAEDDYDQSDDDGDGNGYDDDEEGDYDDDTLYAGVCRVSCDCVHAMAVKKDSTDETLFILDSGCNGANVCNNEQLLDNCVATDIKVQGVSGHHVKAKCRGTLGKAGNTLCVQGANGNLLSLQQMVSDHRGHFEGDSETFTVYDSDNKVIVTARNRGDGFWTCKYSDLCDKVKAYYKVYEKTERHYSAEERDRAKSANELCNQLGHPSDQAVITALDNGLFSQLHLTSQDFRNARDIYGPCPHCIEGKMRLSKEKTSISPPANEIGEHLHGDLIILRNKSIGGYNFILFMVDEKSGYCIGVPLETKGKKSIEDAMKGMVQEYNQYGHKVLKITCDDERTLMSAKAELAALGVHLDSTPPDLHEKRAERYIQTLKRRKAAMLASLPYELPGKLEGEAYLAAIRCMNLTPNKASGSHSPYQLVTRKRPDLPLYYFGQTGVFNMKRQDKPDEHGEWGIFLGYGNVNGFLRAYIPHRDGVYGKRKFIPNPRYPNEWNLSIRVKPTDQVLKRQEPKKLDPFAPPGLTAPTKPEALNVPVQGAAPSAAAAQKPSVTYSQDTIDIDDNVHPHVDETTVVPTPISREGATTAVNTPDMSGEGALPSMPVPAAMPTTPPQISTAPPATVSPPRRRQLPAEIPTRVQPARPAKDKPKIYLSKRQQYKVDKHVKAMMKDPHGVYAVICFKLSIRKALSDKEKYKQALASIYDEIDNMEKNKVMKPILFRDIPRDSRGRIIPVHMFIKDKYRSDGSFDKVKARLVANGDRVPPDMVGETMSPTVNPISVMTQINLAAVSGSLVAAYDIKGAFLLAPVIDGKQIFVCVPEEVAVHWVARYPDRAKYVHDNGRMYFLLRKYLYGLPEAPYQFNSLLDQRLQDIGLVPSKADPCLYVKEVKEGRIIVSTHVDDMLFTGPNLRWRSWFEQEMKVHFELVTQYDDVSYLGMSIRHDKKHGSISVSQEGYVSDILKKYGCDKISKPPKTPATDTLLTVDPDSPPCDARKYLSLVMTLMYLARFTRPDILMPVTFLATRNSGPTEEDMAKAMRVVRYLAGDISKAIHYKCNVPIKPTIFADASHCIHGDGRGHGGIILTLGSGPIHCRSFKLKATTRSSSESELYCLEEASTYTEWYTMLLGAMGVGDTRPIRVYQDNKSTIIMAVQGGNFKRTKHMLCKESYVRERILNGDMELKYLETKSMVADLLTKPLGKFLLNKFLLTLHIV